MTSIESLRDFISQRLSVAAAEIFAVLERTIVEFEEQMERRQDVTGRPQITFQGGDCTQQCVYIKNLLCDQETTSNLSREEPARSQISEQQVEPTPPQIKEEEEEPSLPQFKEEPKEHNMIGERQQLLLRQETEDPIKTYIADESDYSETKSMFASLEMGRYQIQIDDKLYFCSECGKRFISRNQLNRHKKSHTSESPYSCSECSKSLTTQYLLNINETAHTIVRPYSCLECNKTFMTKSHLKSHKIIHTGERPYSCSECSKTFNRKESLNDHKRIHTGEKPYSCSVCSESFSYRSALSVHKRTHTGEYP